MKRLIERISVNTLGAVYTATVPSRFLRAGVFYGKWVKVKNDLWSVELLKWPDTRLHHGIWETGNNWFICPGNIVTLLWFRVIWSYSDCWSLAWINFFSSPKGPWLVWIQHQLLLPLIEKQAPALWESRQGRVKSWVGDGTGRPWENGARHLDPPRLGMFLRVSAKGSWLRHRQRWAGVSR